MGKPAQYHFFYHSHIIGARERPNPKTAIGRCVKNSVLGDDKRSCRQSPSGVTYIDTFDSMRNRYIEYLGKRVELPFPHEYHRIGSVGVKRHIIVAGKKMIEGLYLL